MSDQHQDLSIPALIVCLGAILTLWLGATWALGVTL